MTKPLAFVLAALAAASCSLAPAPAPVAFPSFPASVRLQQTQSLVRLQAGDTKDLAALVSGTHDLTWSTSDDHTVSVDANGQVKAQKLGVAFVTAVAKADASAKVAFAVDVSKADNAVTVSVTPPAATVKVGETLPLVAEVHLADGTINGNVTWSSSDDTIASVNATTGKVTGLRAGRVTVVAAYSADSSYRGLADLTVQ